jgi:hypothetical protein
MQTITIKVWGGRYMIKLLQMLIAVLVLVAVEGCVSFVYKTEVPSFKESFTSEKEVGITIYGDVVPNLFTYMKEQINEFAGRQLNIRNVKSGVTLREDHMMLENIDSLNVQFPNMRFIIVMWQDPVQLSYYASLDCGDIGVASKDCKNSYMRYSTTAKLKCETMLFDLNGKMLVAKATDTFRTSKSYYEYYDRLSAIIDLPSNIMDFYGNLFDMLGIKSYEPVDKRKYPIAEFQSHDFRPFFRPYFTNFLF